MSTLWYNAAGKEEYKQKYYIFDLLQMLYPAREVKPTVGLIPTILFLSAGLMTVGKTYVSIVYSRSRFPSSVELH